MCMVTFTHQFWFQLLLWLFSRTNGSSSRGLVLLTFLWSLLTSLLYDSFNGKLSSSPAYTSFSRLIPRWGCLSSPVSAAGGITWGLAYPQRIPERIWLSWRSGDNRETGREIKLYTYLPSKLGGIHWSNSLYGFMYCRFFKSQLYAVL